MKNIIHVLYLKKKKNTIKIDYVVSSLSMGESIPEDLLESFQTQYTAVQIPKGRHNARTTTSNVYTV